MPNLTGMSGVDSCKWRWFIVAQQLLAASTIQPKWMWAKPHLAITFAID